MFPIKRYLQDIDTPQVVVFKEILLQNIRDMQKFADESNVKLRPHIKSHKIPEIAKIQIDEGARGITVSKLGEAQAMINSGVDDVFIAYEIVGETKINRLIELTRKARVCVAVDSLENASELNRAFAAKGLTLDVLLEIDVGLKRCGVKPSQDAIQLAKQITKLPNLNLKGIFTHAGQVYGALSYDEVVEIGRKEGETMVNLAKQMKKEGIELKEISVGSTPTAKISGKVKGITEIRPGNYVFYDAIQMGLGIVSARACSLRVVSTVISIPAKNRAVIDAGSKTLALDKGAHGVSVVSGFGYIRGYESLTITRLSEEHGIIEGTSTKDLLHIGHRIEIIPNHACPVINLTDEVAVIDGGEVKGFWKVLGRGKSK